VPLDSQPAHVQDDRHREQQHQEASISPGHIGLPVDLSLMLSTSRLSFSDHSQTGE
jgi:hypothetical protein